MSVRLAVSAGTHECPPFDRRLLRRQAERILDELGHAESELSVSLVEDQAIAALNERYRGKAEATDVLSFSLLEGEQKGFRGELLGDVVIGIETAARQASQGGRSFDEEVARLLIHGVLHLLGHDHEDPAEARAMRGEETRLWRALEP